MLENELFYVPKDIRGKALKQIREEAKDDIKFQSTDEEYPNQAEREKVMMESFRNSDPRRAELVKKIADVESMEQLIDKSAVNLKAWRAMVKDRGMAPASLDHWFKLPKNERRKLFEKEKEFIIEDIGQ